MIRFPSILLFFAFLAAAPAAQEITSIIAKVNGKAITKHELRAQMIPHIHSLKLEYGEKNPRFIQEIKKLESKILEELINNKLIITELQQKGAQIPDNIVDQEISRIIRENYKGSESEFRKQLKEDGVRWADFRESQREKILIQAFKGDKFREVPEPTDADLKKEYRDYRKKTRDFSKDQIQYQKIYILKNHDTDPSINPATQSKLANTIYKKAVNGSNFSELAKKHSADAYAKEGGQWPLTSREDLHPNFAFFVMEYEPGQVTPILEDGRGYTICKVNKKILGPAKPFSKVKPLMKRRALEQKRNAKFKKWISTQRENAMVEVRLK